MSKLSKKDVLHIAKLSKLKLSDKETEKFASQLSGIIEYIELLNQVDTKNVVPTSQVTNLNNVFRKDVVKNPKSRQLRSNLLTNSPKVSEGLIEVPRIFSNN